MSTTTAAPGNLVREGTLNALRALTSRGSTWPEPTLSVGRKIGKFGGKELCWEAVGPARESFVKISPRIKEHLENGVEAVSSWVTWSMYMIGKSPELACPTIVFCCEVPAHRKLVRDVIKDSGLLDKYPGIKTGHTSRPPDFNQLVQMADVGARPALDLVIKGLVVPDSNACGMELVIHAESQDFFASRAATVGGVVQLGERFFYLTAEHAFRVASQQDPYGESSYSDTDSDFSIDQDVISHGTDDDLELDCAAMSKVDICDDNDSLQGSEPFIVAPTLIEFRRQKQTVLRETVRLSSVSISSRADLATNLDYNLIEVSEASHQVPNSINHGGRTLTVRNIVVDGPKDVRILAITSRGILSGRLSGTSMYTSLPTANTYQEVYYVTLDCPLEIGDCGAWIIHASTGDLFGHIVAGSPETGAAMIIPAAFIFNDLEDRTQLRPRLPMATIQSSPEYMGDKEHQTKEKEYSLPPAQLTQYDIEWTKNTAAQFVDLMRQKHKQNIRNRVKKSAVVVQGASMAESPPSYDQSTKDATLRGRFRTRFPLIPEPPAEGDKDAQKFRNLLMSLSYVPLSYENDELLELARVTMPLEEISAKAALRVSTYEENSQGSSVENQPHWDLTDCWGKALTYVIAFSVDGATDVTRRYLRAVSLFRERPRTRCSEEALVYILREITAMRRTSMEEDKVARLKEEDAREQRELAAYMVASITNEFVSSLGLDDVTQGDEKRRAEELADREYSQAREA
ncbi:peptidase (PNG1) [Cordyceps militaris CM01]|uniref:Peptidase (PNG1) n=1 Tax=Cordyceps militaris (strain CM01) TaxID=983644 RepID=G3JHS0_CORMM|nr:peptidase (PNG1) [Cordyceps militaris CM01]EGX91776.1 peptidase (PNG1) [Cordyceps militaris CM01]